MEVMIIQIVIEALGTVTKGLIQSQEDLEIIGCVARIPRRVLET